MLTRFVSRIGAARALTWQQFPRFMGGQAPAHWKTDKELAIENGSHMNSFPVPEGSWQEQYNKRNSRWNMQLGAAAAILIATVFAMNQTECLYLHGTPPRKN